MGYRRRISESWSMKCCWTVPLPLLDSLVRCCRDTPPMSSMRTPSPSINVLMADGAVSAVRQLRHRKSCGSVLLAVFGSRSIQRRRRITTGSTSLATSTAFAGTALLVLPGSRTMPRSPRDFVSVRMPGAGCCVDFGNEARVWRRRGTVSRSFPTGRRVILVL